MHKFFDIFKSDRRNRKSFNCGYLTGVYYPETLPELKKKFSEMSNSSFNLKKHKALTQGYLLGYQDRTKARLGLLEQRMKQKQQTKEISRGR
jgi:hypothetical protein